MAGEINNSETVQKIVNPFSSSKNDDKKVEISDDLTASVFNVVKRKIAIQKSASIDDIMSDNLLSSLTSEQAQQVRATLEQMAELDGENGLSKSDMGLWQFGNNMLVTTEKTDDEGDLDLISKMSGIVQDYVKGSLSEQEFLEKISSDFGIDYQSANDVLWEIKQRDTKDVSRKSNKATLSSSDLEKLGMKSATDLKFINQESSTQVQNSTSQEEPNLGLQEGIKPQKDGDNWYIQLDDWEGNEENEKANNTLSRVIKNLYGVEYNSEEGRKIRDLLIEANKKNGVLDPDNYDFIKCGEKLILIDATEILSQPSEVYAPSSYVPIDTTVGETEEAETKDEETEEAQTTTPYAYEDEASYIKLDYWDDLRNQSQKDKDTQKEQNTYIEYDVVDVFKQQQINNVNDEEDILETVTRQEFPNGNVLIIAHYKDGSNKVESYDAQKGTTKTTIYDKDGNVVT
ncbi:hypothetical protein IJ670_07715 [bacterium]|nr:hypothetical protein [bacterium]